ncbi:MAG TPA: 3-hydroxyacyl-CoA dehydrogenase [Usitatibacter sp.]|jgi:3-hydroxybutyryl-CoA dehydrogenase|nr:3-hydroxyacyl-CoA dehydrogenase [Usitatibacter sp.]
MDGAPRPLVGIAGTGLMGRGIAQVAAQAGFETLLYDTRAGTAAAAREAIVAQLQRLAEKGKVTAAAALEAGARLKPVASLAGFAGCGVVIEAIVEDLEAKCELFRALERVVGPDCLLATNTSSLSVTAIAAACARPERVGGFHFFSPVPLMKIVEVIEGVRSDPSVAERLTAIARAFGHVPVRAKDTPGFLVNHAGRAYGTEALRILSEGIADFPAIDDVLREAAGFRMGPFELLDLTGLDVSQPVMESIYHQFHEEPRFRPSPLLLQRKLGGLLGRKSGRGFYAYEDGVKQVPPAPPPPAPRAAKVWVAAKTAPRAALEALVARLGGQVDAAERPAADSICLLAPWDSDATAAALAEGVDPRRSVAIDAQFGLASRRTLMTTPITDPAVRDAAHGLFAADGIPVCVIHDSPGFIAPRVVAQVVNVACDIAQQRIATPEDIDRAVTLGLGYRQGPLAMGDALGPARVLSLLEGLLAFYGDPRYRPSPWLTRRARLGVPLSTPEG